MSTPDRQDGPVHPELTGGRVRLRPGDERDAPVLSAILAEPEVACWWGNPDPVSVVAAGLRGDDESVLLVVETAGQVIGGIQYHEENDPMYRHAGIDIYLSARGQGQGLGTEAVGLLARYLWRAARATTGSPSTRRPTTTGLSAAMRRSASAGWACCASMSAARTDGSTMAC